MKVFLSWPGTRSRKAALVFRDWLPSVSLFFPELKERKITVGSVSLLPATLAFVAGLGVSPIYGAFESLSRELARRIKGTGDSEGGSR